MNAHASDRGGPADRFQRILVPTDFSEGSMAALELAAALARDQQAELLIVHVAPPRESGPGHSSKMDRDLLALHRLLDETRPSDPDVPFRHLALSGEPAEMIVDAAARERVDLIVIATHGRSGLSRLLLGSVAEAVVRTAACPVLTLKS